VDTPRPSPRTNRTRRVPHPVLIGHAASLTPYSRGGGQSRRMVRHLSRAGPVFQEGGGGRTASSASLALATEAPSTATIVSPTCREGQVFLLETLGA